MSNSELPDPQSNKIIISTEDLEIDVSREVSGHHLGYQSQIPVVPSLGHSFPVAPIPERLPGLGPNPHPLNVTSGLERGSGQSFATSSGMTYDQALIKLGSNSVTAGLVAGGVGGFIGWIFSEILASPDHLIFGISTAGIDAGAAVWVMIFAACLGFVLLGWEGFTSRSSQKMVREGGVGAAIGAGAGFAGGFISQAIYGALVNPFSAGGVNILIRGLGWGIFGALVGLGFAFRKGSSKAIVNGVLGGASGGFAAGVIFELLGLNQSGGGAGLRMIGLTITGVGIGLGIGLITHVRRDAWLLFSGGPMRGKEFILDAEQTRFGSDYHCDVVLVKDQSVAPYHVIFLRSPHGMTTVSPQGGALVAVNGIPTSGTQLRSGDSISIGASLLTYQERTAVAAR